MVRSPHLGPQLLLLAAAAAATWIKVEGRWAPWVRQDWGWGYGRSPVGGLLSFQLTLFNCEKAVVVTREGVFLHHPIPP